MELCTAFDPLLYNLSRNTSNFLTLRDLSPAYSLLLLLYFSLSLYLSISLSPTVGIKVSLVESRQDLEERMDQVYRQEDSGLKQRCGGQDRSNKENYLWL